MTMIQVHDSQSLDRSIRSTGMTIVDYGAPWCPPCNTLLPILEQLNEAHEHAVTIVKVNCDEMPEAAARVGVMSMPTVLLYKDGEPVERLVGLRPKSVYEELIRKHGRD
jgi:thioredoxin 1